MFDMVERRLRLYYVSVDKWWPPVIAEELVKK